MVKFLIWAGIPKLIWKFRLLSSFLVLRHNGDARRSLNSSGWLHKYFYRVGMRRIPFSMVLLFEKFIFYTSENSFFIIIYCRKRCNNFYFNFDVRTIKEIVCNFLNSHEQLQADFSQ